MARLISSKFGAGLLLLGTIFVLWQFMTVRATAQIEHPKAYHVVQHVVISDLERTLNEQSAKGWKLQFVQKEATSVYFLVFDK